MRNGHETAEHRFDQLYRETSDDVFAYLVRRSRTKEDAADALAETYAAAWRKLDSLPAGDRARLWLFGAARNELHRMARRRQADDHLDATLADEPRASWESGPEASHDHNAVREALATLSGVDQEILTLTAWEGLTPRQIAAVLGLSANVVRIRLHRARSSLAEILRHDRHPGQAREQSVQHQEAN